MKRIFTYTIVVMLTLTTFRVVAEPAGNEATTEIVASGVGIDADKALHNALINAVQQAVGLVVDAETLVKNEDVVKDQILTYSDGYVEHFDKIKEGKRDDGLYEVKIKATVKKRQLVEKLKASKVITTKVAGESIFGEVITQMAAEKNAGALLEHALEGLPLSLLRAEVVNQKPKIEQRTALQSSNGKPQITWTVNSSGVKVGTFQHQSDTVASDTGVKATWTILITYDKKEYKEKVLPKLQAVLGDIARRKDDFPYVGIPYSSSGGIMGGSSVEEIYRASQASDKVLPVSRIPYFSNDVNYSPELPSVERGSEFLVLLGLDFNERLGQERFNGYVLDENLFPILQKISSRQLVLKVSLLDAEDRPLLEEVIDRPPINKEPQGRFSGGIDGWFVVNGRTLTISPLFRTHGAYNYGWSSGALCRGIEIPWTADVSLETMKQVTKIRCQLVDKTPTAVK